MAAELSATVEQTLLSCAKLLLAANWSLLAKFDDEFASASQTYAGSGTLRYRW